MVLQKWALGCLSLSNWWSGRGVIPHSVTRGLLFLVHENCILNGVFISYSKPTSKSSLQNEDIRSAFTDCRKAQTRENGQYTWTNFVWSPVLHREHYYKVPSIYIGSLKALPTWCNSQPLTETLRYIRHFARCCGPKTTKSLPSESSRTRLEKKKQRYHQILLSVLKGNAKEAYRRGMCYQGLGIEAGEMRSQLLF